MYAYFDFFFLQDGRWRHVQPCGADLRREHQVPLPGRNLQQPGKAPAGIQEQALRQVLPGRVRRRGGGAIRIAGHTIPVFVEWG